MSGAGTAGDWRAFREGFAALSRPLAYLSTAGGAPLSRRAAAEGARYFAETEAEGDAPWPRWLERTDAVRASAAVQTGGAPQDLDILASTAAALNAVAPYVPEGAPVVAIEDEFPSVTLPFVNRGHPIRRVPIDGRGAPDLDALARALPGAGALTVGHVQFRTGRRLDLQALGALCREAGALLIVDATQSLGAGPVDAGPADVLVASGDKWLCAGYGAAAVHLSPRLRERPSPVFGWRSAETPYALKSFEASPSPTAVRLEMGHPPFAPVFALGGALAHLADTLGGGDLRAALEAARARIAARSDRLREGVAAEGGPAPLAPPGESGIHVFPAADAPAAKAALAEAGILATASTDYVRLSLHAFVAEEEVDRAALALSRALRAAA